MKLPRNWASVRRAALRRAGWRSERSGKAGKLEVHHLRGRAYSGPGDLEVLTRAEHISEHAGDRRREVGPLARAWYALLSELLSTETQL